MKRKALVLTSGGLDSILTMKILEREGIEPVGVHFITWFNIPKYRLCEDFGAEEEFLGFRLLNVNLSEEYTPILLNPRYGYGSGANPCIDCKILFFKKAEELARETDADFVASGEVVGQRPMSQSSNIMRLIEKKSGLQGRLLRPLSAKLLDETIPERERWVKREQLYAVSGRGRKVQMELARQFGIERYPVPAGGCILTEKNFFVRFKELVEHKRATKTDDLFILRYGRQFRLPGGCKLVVGRHKEENEFLQRLTWGNLEIDATAVPGPYSVMEWDGSVGEIRQALRIVVRYSDTLPSASEETVVLLFDLAGRRRCIPFSNSATQQQIESTLIR
jgi:tRNA-specific 2-thiouridylase